MTSPRTPQSSTTRRTGERLRIWIVIGAVGAAGATHVGAQQSRATTKIAAGTQDPAVYAARFRDAEAAKARGDYGAMEAALEAAFRAGPGDEYAWRSLAWAEARGGKWEESLAHAEENLRRHSETGWTLRQQFDSASVAGDLALMQSSLARADLLPPERRNADHESDRRLLSAWTTPRTYELTWRIPPPSDVANSRPTRWLIPDASHGWQRCEVTAEGARSAVPVLEGGRRFLDLVHRPGEPVTLKARVVHVPVMLGARRLAAETAQPIDAQAAAWLGSFINRVAYDPADPAAAALAATLRRPTRAGTVQAVLDWMADNLRYEAGHDDALNSILSSRRGVCHHFSNLAVTLCRAAGVPAFVAHGVRLPDEGAFIDHGGSHGWIEVQLDQIGWTPVEPLDRNSLRRFGGAGYLFFDVSGRGMDDDHFRFTSLQGIPVTGRVVESHAR